MVELDVNGRKRLKIKNNKMKRKSIEIFIIVIIIIIFYSVVDLSFGILKPIKPYASNPERLTSKAYTNEPYFSEEFLIESFIQPGGWLSPEGTRLIFPQEFHGKFFNVDILPPTNAPYRRTFNNDTIDKSIEILILGGSTVYCSEVPDNYTVPSILAQNLNKNGKKNYYILNAGVTSANSTQELERLRYELHHGLKPDIVIVYHGINDITHGIYFGDPDGVMFSNRKRNRLKEILTKVLPLNVYYYFRKKSEADSKRIVPDNMKDIKILNSLAYETREKYKKNILEMHNLAVSNGFRLIVILQPNVFTTNNSKDKEFITGIKRIAELRTPKISLAFAVGYPLLEDELAAIKAKGIEAYDISNMFDRADSDIFLDMSHVNSHGNKMVAEFMQSVILGRRSLY